MKRIALVALATLSACWDFGKDYDQCVVEGRCGDAGTDAGVDGGGDAGFDGGADAGFDGGSDAGTDAGTDAGLNTLADFCTATSTAICDFAKRCGYFETKQGCVDFFTRLGPIDYCRQQYAADVDSGHAAYDPVEARSCVEALLDSGACTLDPELFPSPCTRVVVGRLDAGAGCFDRDECKPGLYCEAKPGACANGHCQPRKSGGVGATEVRECAETAFFAASICFDRFGVGAGCSANSQCQKGLSCQPLGDGGHQCKMPQSIGGQCVTVRECGSGLVCTAGQCSAPRPRNQQCALRFFEGLLESDCQFDLHCSTLQLDAGGTCLGPGAPGSQCLISTECAAGSYCGPNPDGGNIGVCAPRLMPGLGCFPAVLNGLFQCVPTAWCSPTSSMCELLSASANGPCSGTLGCATGLTCVANACQLNCVP